MDGFRAAFDVPTTYTPIGAITVGHKPADPAQTGAQGSPARRARRDPGEVVHRGRWGGGS